MRVGLSLMVLMYIAHCTLYAVHVHGALYRLEIQLAAAMPPLQDQVGVAPSDLLNDMAIATQPSKAQASRVLVLES